MKALITSGNSWNCMAYRKAKVGHLMRTRAKPESSKNTFRR